MNPLILEAANSSRRKPDLAALGMKLPASDDALAELLHEAIGYRVAPAASAIVIAAFLAQRRFPADLLVVGFALLDCPTAVQCAVAGAQGNVSASLLTSLREHSTRPLQRAQALWYILDRARAENGIVPKEAISEIRKSLRAHSRYGFDPFEFLVLRDLSRKATEILPDDAYVDFYAPDDAPFLEDDRVEKALRDLVGPPSFDAEEFMMIPDRPVLVAPIRRAAEKVGRNAPCPCGSGKKFKKCCAKQNRETLNQSSEVPGVTQVELWSQPERYLTEKRLLSMSPTEISGFDPVKIPSSLVVPCLRCLMDGNEFEAAVTLLEAHPEMEERALRAAEVLHECLEMRRYELLARLVSIPGIERQYDRVLELELALNAPDRTLGPILEAIEKLCREALQNDSPTDVDLAHALLRSRDLPVLGIYLARAVMMTRKYDRDMLLDHIDETRDVLGLPLYDELEPVLAMLETAEAAQVYETREAEKMCNLYQDLQERNRAMDRLRGELSEARNDLKRTERMAARPKKTEARPIPTPQPARPEGKYCKEEIKRLHNERNALARQLRKLREARNLEKSPKPAMAIGEEDVALEGEEQVQHPVRIPLFSPAFTEGIKRMPQQIAARAVAFCGQLAAGESGSFHHVKRIKRHRDFHRAKVGDYRILLQLQEEALHVIDIFPRQDLERKLATLA